MILTIIPMFIGTTELVLIAGVALLLFGGKKLPEMMRGMGKGVQEFKKGMTEPLSTDDEQQNEETKPQDFPEEATKEPLTNEEREKHEAGA